LSDSSILEPVDRLFTLLAERRIDYLLVEGIAHRPEIMVTGREEGFLRGLFEGLRVDLLLTSNPLFEIVQRRYGTTQPFVEREIPCATVEGIILLKLYALPSLYRQGDLVRAALYETDILTLIHGYQPKLEPLFQELAPHVSETDLAALRKLVAELEARIARFGERF